MHEFINIIICRIIYCSVIISLYLDLLSVFHTIFDTDGCTCFCIGDHWWLDQLTVIVSCLID